jgi:hypothetical protein
MDIVQKDIVWKMPKLLLNVHVKGRPKNVRLATIVCAMETLDFVQIYQPVRQMTRLEIAAALILQVTTTARI